MFGSSEAIKVGAKLPPLSESSSGASVPIVVQGVQYRLYVDGIDSKHLKFGASKDWTFITTQMEGIWKDLKLGDEATITMDEHGVEKPKLIRMAHTDASAAHYHAIVDKILNFNNSTSEVPMEKTEKPSEKKPAFIDTSPQLSEPKAQFRKLEEREFIGPSLQLLEQKAQFRKLEDLEFEGTSPQLSEQEAQFRKLEEQEFTNTSIQLSEKEAKLKKLEKERDRVVKIIKELETKTEEPEVTKKRFIGENKILKSLDEKIHTKGIEIRQLKESYKLLEKKLQKAEKKKKDLKPLASKAEDQVAQLKSIEKKKDRANPRSVEKLSNPLQKTQQQYGAVQKELQTFIQRKNLTLGNQKGTKEKVSLQGITLTK